MSGSDSEAPPLPIIPADIQILIPSGNLPVPELLRFADLPTISTTRLKERKIANWLSNEQPIHINPADLHNHPIPPRSIVEALKKELSTDMNTSAIHSGHLSPDIDT
jgi:hypothetical protein